MPNWTPDTIDGAVLDLSFGRETQVVTGVVSEIDTSVDPRELLWSVISFLASVGHTLNPPSALSVAHPNLLLQRIRVQGISGDAARVWMSYDLPEFGPPTAFIIRHGSTLTTKETDLLPGTRIPIRIKDCVVTSEDGLTVYPIKGDNVLMRLLFPLETIRVTALSYGSPKPGRIRGVNDATWPVGQAGFTSYPPGYWIIAQWETTEAKYSGYFTWDAVAMTRVDEDWSETGTLVDTRIGKHIPIDPLSIAAMNAPPYIEGLIFQNSGLIRVGAYPFVNFPAIFGF